MKIADKKNILIIRLSSLGDIILTTPIVREIKKGNPNCKIDVLVKPEFKDVYIYNPHINNILEYQEDKLSVKALKEHISKNYDCVIDLQNNKKSKKITRFIKTPLKRFKKKNWSKFFLVHLKINKIKKVTSVVTKYASTCKDLEMTSLQPEVFTNEEYQSQLKKDEKYVAFIPGSKHYTKIWPIEYFIELGNNLANLGCKIVLLGGKDDKSIAQYLSIYIKNSINLVTDDNLLQILTDLKKCKLVVCNDSGLMHLATTTDIPIVTIFGSSVKEFGFIPNSEKAVVIENPEIKCRPCSHIGKDFCPKKHFNCMKTIKPEKVLSEISTLENLI